MLEPQTCWETASIGVWGETTGGMFLLSTQISFKLEYFWRPMCLGIEYLDVELFISEPQKETSRSSEKEAFEKSGDLNSTFTILVEPAAVIRKCQTEMARV